MKHTFKYDVAISAVDFDALAAAELQRRLDQRLGQAIFASVASATSPRSPAAATTARHAFEKDARVVVVLFQRLWGSTLSTEADAAAIRARIAKSGRRGVYVIRLDGSSMPSWLKGGSKSRALTPPSSDAVVGQIVAAVDDAHGTPLTDTAERVAARAATEEARVRARTTF